MLRSVIVWTMFASAAFAQAVRTIDAAALEDRIQGGLLGQLIGNLNGLKHENKYVAEPGQVEQYVPAIPEGAWTDDDTDIEWVYLFGMERDGVTLLPPRRVAQLWQAHINRRIWCSHRYLRQLMNLGFEPPLTGSMALNPWAGFNLSGQFVSEGWGLISPGLPAAAARTSLHYLKTSISGEPAQAAQMFAAMVAVSFFEPDIARILDAGAATLDPRSRMAAVVADVRAWHREFPRDWKATRSRLRDKYTLVPERIDQRDLNGVILNGGSTIAALLYGGGDFVETVRTAFNFGWDADNNAATAGTILGVLRGRRWLTSQGWAIGDSFRNTSRDGLPDETITRFGARLLRLAGRVIVENGGRQTAAGYAIPFQKPAMAEPLEAEEAQTARLRKALRADVERSVLAPENEQAAARAAYTAIALDMAADLQAREPKRWKQAVDCLAGYAGVVQLLFYDSPGETGAGLRRRALAAGLAQPEKQPAN